jgi:hypothetical protein
VYVHLRFPVPSPSSPSRSRCLFIRPRYTPPIQCSIHSYITSLRLRDGHGPRQNASESKCEDAAMDGQATNANDAAMAIPLRPLHVVPALYLL